MKKILAVVCILVILGGVFFLVSQRSSQLDIEQVVPEGSLFYAHFSDMEDTFEKVKATQFWKTFVKINWEKALMADESNEKVLAEFLALKEKIEQVSNSKILKEVVSKEVAVSVYPYEKKLSSFQSLDEVFSNVVVVARVGAEVRAAEAMASMLKKWSNEIVFDSFDYEGTTVNTAELKKQNVKIRYLYLNDLIVLALSDKPVKAVIDVSLKNKASISEEEDYQKIKVRVQKSDENFMYANVTSFVSSLKGQLEPVDRIPGSDSSRQIEAVFKKFSGFKALGYSFIMDKIIEKNFVVMIDRQDLDPQLSAMYACNPVGKSIPEFVPAQILVYQWSNCNDFSFLWRQIKEEMSNMTEEDEKNALPMIIVNSIEESLNLDIEQDVIPSLGKQVGLYLSDIETSGLFPFPKLVAFLEVKDQAKVQKVMEALTNQQYILLQSEEYEGIPIKYVSVPIGMTVQPGYCFLDGSLLIASSRQLLKEAIDTQNGKGVPLLKDESLSVVDKGLSQENNGVLFVKVGEAVRKIKGIVDWSSNWLNLKAAHRDGSKQRLEDLRKDINFLEDDLVALKEENLMIEEEVLKIKIEEKEKDLDLARAKEKELLIILEQMEADTLEARKGKIYLDEIVYPLMEAFSSFKSCGVKTIFQDEFIEIFSYIKME